MIKNIVTDIKFLQKKSTPATKLDANIIKDIQDTLLANKKSCVGMAANMIGYSKRIIIVDTGLITMTMLNPKIIKKSESYETEEGCLSLIGIRKTKRYNKIEVEYEDVSFKKHIGKFNGFTAQIIQHEIDHCNGIII
ncbi:MAG: peptide deformylase [Candidatus Pseudoruminococcus sp.]|nr:peptide deformylase [Ruminococcus sp.]MDY2783117.1 peptide deformylase [Candidatus Pseudoruminococcus sp.]